MNRIDLRSTIITSSVRNQRLNASPVPEPEVPSVGCFAGMLKRRFAVREMSQPIVGENVPLLKALQ